MSAELDFDELRKIAKAATQDFWWHDLVGAPGQRPEDQEWVVDSNPNFICSTQVGTKRGEQDAAHIAAFDPPTVLALLDAVTKRTAYQVKDRGELLDLLEAADRRASAAEAQVVATRELHGSFKEWIDDREHVLYCEHCRVLAPCPTIAALDGTS